VIKAFKKDYHETLLDGLRIYHNPFAIHPLDGSVFDLPGVYQGCFDLDTNERLYRGEGEHLVYRTLTTYFNPNEAVGPAASRS
jgi:hypothetical protein